MTTISEIITEYSTQSPITPLMLERFAARLQIEWGRGAERALNDKTVATVLKKIDEQLAWRGPQGKEMGIITLPRGEAQYLRDTIIKIIMERDELVFNNTKRISSG